MIAEHVASIVIPTFNRAQLLPRAIDTALAQSVPCEVIVCDHGSTDATPAIAAGYKDRVRYIRRDVDHGPIFCWLDGIISVTTPYIHLTFDDDWIDEVFIERCLGVFAEDCAFVFTGTQVHRGAEVMLEQHVDLFPTGTHDRSEAERFLLGLEFTVSPGCALFRKEDAVSALMASDNPLARHRYHGAGPDMLMFLLPLLRYTRFGFVNERLAHFLAHDGSITTDATADEDKHEALRRTYAEAKRYYQILRHARDRRWCSALGAAAARRWPRLFDRLSR
ncbi:MAG TPA: glycosyltransferase family 2 protein [Stellaceae bacterium]|nr:glycosyltransferase family 2 protein [Stellaceae bacterium]